MNRLDTADVFADPVGEHANSLYPFLAELIHLPLQLWDDVTLNRIERDRGEAEDWILDEHEHQDRQQGAALKRRQGQRVADEPAQRFHLGGYHRNDFTLADFPEMRQRKAQNPRVQVIAQTPQHPLPQLPAEHVDVIFEGAVDAHQCKEHAG